MAIRFSRYLQGQYIYPHKDDETPFTDQELASLVEHLNTLQLSFPKPGEICTGKAEVDITIIKEDV